MTISLLGLLVAGSSLAYFIDQDEHTQALFVVGSVEMASSEGSASEMDISDPLIRKGSWTIKNTGSQAIMIRAELSSEWTPSEPGSYAVSVTSVGWQEKDGLYYYCEPVLPQAEIPFEVEVNVINDNGSYWEGDVALFYEAEAVQADNEAIQAEWPDSPCQQP